MNFIKASLRYPVVTLTVALLTVLLGLHAFFKMPRTEDPNVTIRTGIVLAQYPGATSEQVEKQVTKTLEKHIFKFPEVRKERTYSTSRPGLVIINVELEDNVKNSDLFWAKLRHEMNEVRATELPDGVLGPIVNDSFGDTVAMLIAVHGKRYGYRELRDYVDRIQDELRTVREVGRMLRYGEQTEQIRITSTISRMGQYWADPGRVIQALQQRNVVEASGSLNTPLSKVPFRTTGLFTTEDQIGSVLVDVSKTGQPVYIRDFARVERRYEDPVFLVRYDGQPCILLSVEMQKGKNIVDLGKEVAVVLERLRTLLPPDVALDLVVNQPEVVKERITHLSHEFLLAIGSVILVTMLLLPLRVAVVAAVAIPVTLCTTLGIMNAAGIDLHQVSIAGLILVLGIVVDDAVVIADNYVDCLDRKVPIPEAAWRSASEVLVPVITATVTIVCSFLPLLIIQGSAGEFIRALPLVVAIALPVSFVVAVMLTPITCRFFIKKGLHADDEGGSGTKGKKKPSVLDKLQTAYNRAIVFFMRRKAAALIMGVAAVGVGVALFQIVPQQFFPSAERNQFVIDVWMRQGTRIEVTDEAMRRIEGDLAKRPEVTHYATFVGQSAPRFYYNVNPQQPDGAYGQFIVNTRSAKETPKLVEELRLSLATLIPEAMVIVKELQQGMVMEAPVEVRISGDDTGELKRQGEQVSKILGDLPSSQFVHRDYYNDSYMVDVNVQKELANRLGLTDSSVSRLLSGAFDGAPVSTFWEGDRPVTITLRLEDKDRTSFADAGNAYLTSQITHASVPLRSVASLRPEWQTSRLVRRNGVRTLTVRSFVKPGSYASSLLAAADPKIDSLKLQPGYRIYFGGERDNQTEVFPQMVAALAISLVAIFLVLLIQLRNVSDPLIVMSSIPLALLGAAFGLVVTRNPFGFTAFMGMISLCGIVVRNAIILVDYVKEKMAEGHSLEQAATEAGERRLRPIFLTTMAAAVGVTPMILSRSALWSPLASVMAIGLIFSMFFTLLVVPVLYVVVKSRANKRSIPAVVGLAVAALVFCGFGHVWAETRQIDLPEVIDLALKNNTALKISQAKVRENKGKVNAAWADYFAHLSDEANFMHLSSLYNINIPAGALGSVPGLGPFPTQSTRISQGGTTLTSNNLLLMQPLTQLLKINEAHNIATADKKGAEADLRKAEVEVVYAARRLYYALLSARKQKEAVQACITAAEEGLRESDKGVRSGALLEINATRSRVELLQNRQMLLTTEIQISDLSSELNDLTGLPLGTELVLADVGFTAAEWQPRERYVSVALSGNPEIAAAGEMVRKAGSAVNAAKDEYIPDIGAFGSYVYQDGVPFVPHDTGIFGLQMKWNIFDWGKREAVVGQRQEQLTQAKQNLRRLEMRVEVEVDKAYRKLEQTKKAADIASEVLLLQKENLRLGRDQHTAGTITDSKYAELIASVKKAESDELQARLGYELALAELDRVVGQWQR
jgi:multidrug efflux pump subunit AcrB/outer membrane protein TolC